MTPGSTRRPLVALEDQDRARWDRAGSTRATAALDRALRLRRPGPYQLEAAITALHVEGADAESTDWAQIAALYRQLVRLRPSSVVRLNHAAAIGYAEGPGPGSGYWTPC